MDFVTLFRNAWNETSGDDLADSMARSSLMSSVLDKPALYARVKHIIEAEPA